MIKIKTLENGKFLLDYKGNFEYPECRILSKEAETKEDFKLRLSWYLPKSVFGNIDFGDRPVPKKVKKKVIKKEESGLLKFIEKSKKENGDKFDYVKVVYVNCKTPITLICRDCETEFETIPRIHLWNMIDCPMCAAIANLACRNNFRNPSEKIALGKLWWKYSKKGVDMSA